MLVYCALPRFASTPGLNALVDAVAEWINKKSRARLHGQELLRSNSRRMPDDSLVEACSLDDAWPRLVSISYAHADRTIAGRRWVTEVGFRQAAADAEIDCSVLVKTDEISARVWAPVSPSRPLVILSLLAAGNPTKTTPGQRAFPLSESDAIAFDYIVKDRDRRHPLILISPTTDGRYLVNPIILQSLLAATADTVLIAPGTDTRALARTLGDDVVPFDGGVSLIYPPRPPRPVPCWRVTPQQLIEAEGTGTSPETEILSLVLHRENLPNSWKHISPDAVKAASLEAELRRRREAVTSSGPTKEYVEFMEEQYNAKSKEVDSLKDKVRQLHEDSVEHEDDERHLIFQIDSLRADLDNVKARSRTGAQDLVLRKLICSAMDGRPQVSEALKLIELVFPDRVVVLPSAFTSAEQADEFRFPEKALGLIWRLATKYWESLAGGRGDAEARQVFGAAFAASESEPVERNRKARALRTFSYGGRPLEMMTHLKIGVKDSRSETLRIHFEWIAEEKRIVIGHCGPHLDFG